MPSSTVENYLKQLYLEQQHAPDRLVSMGNGYQHDQGLG